MLGSWLESSAIVQDQRTGQSRVLISIAAVSLFMLLLLGRVFYLQVISYHDFAARSTSNRIDIVPIAPVRGQIFDRNGVLLAENKVVTQIGIIPSQADDLDALLTDIGQIIPISAEERREFLKSVKRGSSHSMHTLKDFLIDDQIARFAVERFRLKGAYLNSELYRKYNHGELFSHVVGMMNRIDQEDLKQVNPARYRGLLHIGKYGVEKSNEEVLVGWPGFERVETNAHGHKIRRLSVEMPTSGKDVYLSLDYELQKKAFEVMGAKKGAIVALEPSTGKVLAMVSKPGFNPNDFGINSNAEKRTSWLTSEDSPLINRAIQGQYSPGSTIKPFLAIAAEEHGIAHHRIDCPGYYQLPDSKHKFRCWKSEGHGFVSLLEAVAQSCDVYFYRLARKLGIDEMYYYLSKFGFGDYTDINLESELTGILPSKEWKEYERNEPWYAADTVIMGIGQGAFTTTALQLANALAIIANRGAQFTPQVLSKLVDRQTAAEQLIEPQLARVLDLQAKSYENVIAQMEAVVHSDIGTAKRIRPGLQYKIAGKTGTVQLISRAQETEWDASKVPENLQPHGIFFGFAPTEQPKIVVVAIIENGRSGAAVAPLVRQVMDHYFMNAEYLGDQFAVAQG